jgi:Xaa-Pro aminopeptidase
MTNEPGFYKEGEYGIRIENVMVRLFLSLMCV